jgi:hypothetical protein
MRDRSALALAALVAAGLIAMAAGAAFAGRLSLSGRTMRMTWARLEFTVMQEGEIPYTMECPVTMEGSFHSATIRKIPRALVGYINRVAAGSCPAPFSAVPLRETLPWHVKYVSFSGTLPRITAISLMVIGQHWRLSAGAMRCLFRTTEADPAVGTTAVGAGGALSGLAWNPEELIPYINREPLECPFFTEMRMRGTSGPITQVGTTTVVSVTLI